jgi:hypothetical protein
MTIISLKSEKFNMSSELLEVSTKNGEMIIDVKSMLKEPLHSDTAYFNATEIAKMFNVRLMNIFRTKEWKDYVLEMEKQVNFKSLTCETIKKPIKMVKTVRGKYHSGTWLHSKLIVFFLRKINLKFAVAMDLFIQDLIIQVDVLKVERQNTKTLFRPLTKTIKDHYIPYQSPNGQKYAYSSLITLINMIVLGTTAKNYAKIHNIKVENGKTIRDYLDKSKLDRIKKLEEHLNGLILYAKIRDYQTLKEQMQQFI